jgi:hypothetical protein
MALSAPARELLLRGCEARTHCPAPPHRRGLLVGCGGRASGHRSAARSASRHVSRAARRAVVALHARDRGGAGRPVRDREDAVPLGRDGRTKRLRLREALSPAGPRHARTALAVARRTRGVSEGHGFAGPSGTEGDVARHQKRPIGRGSVHQRHDHAAREGMSRRRCGCLSRLARASVAAGRPRP